MSNFVRSFAGQRFTAVCCALAVWAVCAPISMNSAGLAAAMAATMAMSWLAEAGRQAAGRQFAEALGCCGAETRLRLAASSFGGRRGCCWKPSQGLRSSASAACAATNTASRSEARKQDIIQVDENVPTGNHRSTASNHTSRFLYINPPVKHRTVRQTAAAYSEARATRASILALNSVLKFSGPPGSSFVPIAPPR